MKILQDNVITFLCLAVSVCWFPGRCLAIHCYQCGSQDGDALPCDIFIKAPMWRQFEVECPVSPPHLCGKSITRHDDATEPSEVRGCAPAENAFQVRNTIGCGQDDQPDQTVLCLCGTDLCNDASRLRSSTTWLVTPLLSLLFLSHKSLIAL